ncbi:hypothetical protein ACOMHN_037390 [Nucella lapillus]
MSSKEVKNALKVAREAIRSKDFKEALKQCKAALAEDKNNYNALVFVGVAAEGLEQFDQALKAYRRATEVSPDQLLAWQVRRGSLQQFDQALKAYRRATEVSPDQLLAWQVRRGSLQQFDQALKAYRRATEVSPDQLLAWQVRRGSLQQFDQALKAYRRATEVSPDQLLAWQVRRGSLQQFDQALKAYRRATEVSPDQLLAWQVRRGSLQQFDQALKAYRRATEVSPDQLLAWQVRRGSLQQFDQALKAYRRATEVSPDQLLAWQVRRGSLQQFDQALKAYRRATEVSPDQLLAWQVRRGSLQQFDQALKAYRRATEVSPDQLLAWQVRRGSLQQFDQALKAYRRATEVSPDQLLAWQGLSSMHTKNPGQVPREDIVAVYEKLIELYESDGDKQEDSMKKLISLYGDDNLDKALTLYDRLQQKQAGYDHDLVVTLISRLQNQPSLSPQQEVKLVSCLRALLSSSSSSSSSSEAGGGDQAAVPDIDSYVRSYLLLMLKREPEGVYEECRRLVSRFPHGRFPQETQLRLLLDKQMETAKPEEAGEIRKLTSHLTEVSQGESSPVLLLARGYLSLTEGKYMVAKEALEKALSLQRSKSRVVSVSTCSAVQQLHEMAVRCCLLQGGPSSLAQALVHAEELTEGSEQTDMLRAYLYLETNDHDQLKVCMERLSGQSSPAVTALKAWQDFHQQRYADASHKLQKAVAGESTNAQYLLMLGRALWEQRGEGTVLQEQCFNVLLKAAKLDPYMSGTFLYLGHFYAELKTDLQRAKKCYQKAYDLDSSNEEAGAALCDMMAALGEEDSVQSLLKTVTDNANAGCAKWAWLRLGLAQVRTGDPSSATISFQSALRADPSDRHVWECLAEAYLHRGSFTAALKAFTKAVELCPDSIYSLYQMASIKQTLGSLREAVEEYSPILDRAPHYVPALKGLGETYLQIAQRYLSQGLLGLAVDTCQKALTCLTRAATHRPDMSCLWKLMGDCCTALHPLHSPSFQIEVPSRLCQTGATDDTDMVNRCVSGLRIEVPSRLCQTGATDDTDMVTMNKAALMELATKCYGRALKIVPDSAPLWHDLGLGLFYLCGEQGEEAGRRWVVERSVRALKKALTLDPAHHRHWTALGVVAASAYVKNLALAQHCFIKSVQCETNNAVAWTNLGTLYLRGNNIQLAHEAFKVAQSQDPEYLCSWVGQALVAETVGHEEAMDLFRHTTQLGIHMESGIGYGHWVVSTLLDVTRQDSKAFQYCIHQMAAIPAAADALTRYTEVKKEDARAFNMLGLLLEHQGLVLSALDAFRRATQLAEISDLTEDQRIKIRLNLARLLSKNNRYSEAVSVYESCAQTFGDLCQWGLVLYKADRLQDSHGVYQKALAMAETDGERSDVWAAIGMVAYKARNGEDAKSALFQRCVYGGGVGRGAIGMVAYKAGNGDDAKSALFQWCVYGGGMGRGAIGMVAYKVRNGEDAKSALFQSFQLSTPSVQGLLALCALGVLQRDATLTEATLQELSGLVKGGDRLCDVATLTAALKLSQGAGSQALDTVEAMVKESPLNGLYLLMARLALLTHSGHTALASALMTPVTPHAKVKESLLCRTLAQLYVGQHRRGQPAENALTTAQRAVHCRPDDVGALCCLAGALHAEGVIRFVTKGDAALLTREVAVLDLALTSGKVTTTQRAWCLRQKAVTQVMMNDTAGGRDTLKQLQSSGSEGSDLASVLQCVVERNQAELEPLVLRDGTPLFFWQVLVCGLLREGRWQEAGVVVREALHRAHSPSGQVVKVVCLLTMAWMAAQQILMGGGDDDRLVGEVEEACEAVSALSDPSYRLTQVMLALIHRPRNARKAKHHFVNVLEAGHVRSCLGAEVSVARRGILCFLHQSGKDTDTDLIQVGLC